GAPALANTPAQERQPTARKRGHGKCSEVAGGTEQCDGSETGRVYVGEHHPETAGRPRSIRPRDKERQDGVVSIQRGEHPRGIRGDRGELQPPPPQKPPSARPARGAKPGGGPPAGTAAFDPGGRPSRLMRLSFGWTQPRSRRGAGSVTGSPASSSVGSSMPE